MKKYWLESVPFKEPLRDARLVAFRPAAEDLELRLREREQRGYERGRRDGEAALGEQLVRQRAELLELQNGVLDALQRVIPDLIKESERELINLAIEAAQRLVAGLPVSVEMIEASVREALAQVEESTSFTVLLHSADLELLQKANSPLLLPGGGLDRMTFQATDNVSRGGCLVRTNFGTVDGRRETKAALLKEALAA